MLFDLLNLIGSTIINLTTIHLLVTTDIEFPKELGKAIPVEMRYSKGEQSWRLSERTPEELCRYYGYAVPYERTWEERNSTGDDTSVRAPAPGEIEAFAFIVNRKVCSGQPDDNTIYVAVRVFPILNPWRQYSAPEGWGLLFTKLTDYSPDMRPKWLPQVLSLLEKMAETDPQAKIFVEAMTKSLLEEKASQDGKGNS